MCLWLIHAVARKTRHQHSNHPPVKRRNQQTPGRQSLISLFHGLSRRDPSQEETPDSRKMEAEEETSVKTWPFALQPVH